MKLTQRRIEALECPPGRKDMLVFDDEQRGLGVRVTAGGGKSYLAQYSFGGQKQRLPLGSCSAISLADARLAARQIVGAVAGGKDPAGARKAHPRVSARDADPVLSLSRTLREGIDNQPSLRVMRSVTRVRPSPAG